MTENEDDQRGCGVLTIGQFSRSTGFTVKTIRLYHEKGLLNPISVDPSSGYRYFGARDTERARVIGYLRDLEFPLATIKDMLDRFENDASVLGFLEEQRARIETRSLELKRVAASLDVAIRREKEAQALLEHTRYAVEVKDLPELRVAGLRWQGRYADTGKVIGRVFRHFARHAQGTPLNLYYDMEFNDESADIETCVPIREAKEVAGFTIHTLPAGRFACLIHRGPYQEISRSYARAMEHVEKLGMAAAPPFREIYLKGPGMIFRGNPRNYLTEIQIPLAEKSGEKR